MEVDQMTLNELREQKRRMEEEQKKLDAEIKKAEAEELVKARENVATRIENMSQEEKQWLIDHTEHACSSCSDNNVANGLYSAHNGKWRCPKCMLMEILSGEHGGKYDFAISVDIYEVTV
jgi:hypothetical protein